MGSESGGGEAVEQTVGLVTNGCGKFMVVRTGVHAAIYEMLRIIVTWHDNSVL